MNKIRKLKIDAYKRALKERYGFIGVISVFFGDEEPDDLILCKTAHNTRDGKYVRERIVSHGSDRYFSDDKIAYITQKLIADHIHVFQGCSELTFTAEYHGECFRVLCDSSAFIENLNHIEGISAYPILFSRDHRVLLSVMQLEYEIELHVLIRNEC
ncbi:hypothetical protein VIBNISO65_p0072 [Vibrio nigripulchritudo SO65]|uniref:hypothetical protein n=1 Tax=Vibrio nigripulchritudo TaxID=28173 RepID=UPI0003B22F2A|nr:hypothetical protein [Vibrio nigripulchritudo]CCN38663.1 hypothetical protein VIBNIAM115_p0070 [Vibrio nigripulchritudo AM115]CCN44972.1 hypothetical protein VIBNIFTn2_p0069 [Vibrio nigripulchritudo FTn2]CCN79730.1 hypothetical protein VIBNISO65_p0072 [Vibrio nigripulchritudo SO65]